MIFCKLKCRITAYLTRQLHNFACTNCFGKSIEKGTVTMKKLKKIPLFNTEDEERAFWAENDTTEFIDWAKAKKVKFPSLKPSTKTISLRLPEHILDDLKMMARKRDIPYQSLIKIFLKDRLDEELRHSG